MEDILASIRRIINEDEAPAAPPVPPTPAAEPKEVLELTEPLAAGPAGAGGVDLSNIEGSLDGLVREMLQPMLRDWLDANLPDLVRTEVAREIVRITRRD